MPLIARWPGRRILGAEFSFIRPDFSSNDQAATVPIIKHELQYLIEQGEGIEISCCIYVPHIFKGQDLDKVIETVNRFKREA